VANSPAAERESWPDNAAAALAVQDRLRVRVVTGSVVPLDGVRLVAGLDVAYAKDESRVAGAVAVIDLHTGEVVETATAYRPVDFPYVPGMLAFRELPSLLDALEQLRTAPEVLVCDGYGLAHPRRFGLACHLGVLTGMPAYGVAKTAFVGTFEDPGPARGDWSELTDRGAAVGRVLRTRPGVKPVFVSVGHRIGIEDAVALTLRLATRYRLPETTRQADRLSRRALAAAAPPADGGIPA
jgi:deoxyribonuclease V